MPLSCGLIEQQTKSSGAKATCGGRSQAFRLLLTLCCLLSFAGGLFTFVAEVIAEASTESTADDSSARAKNLHQWGAISLFHGLPSDRVYAIAQDRNGVMWFGTDRGLAKYDGRRIHAVVSEGLPSGRVLALKLDMDGALWVGTEVGAAQLVNEEVHLIKETTGHAITAIIMPERGRTVLASSQGVIFDFQGNTDNPLILRASSYQPSPGKDVDGQQTLPLTSLAINNQKLFVGTHGRGMLMIEGAETREIQSRPRAFFINDLETDGQGHLWLGAKAKREDSGLYLASDSLRPVKIGAGIGTVEALRIDNNGDLWVGTSGHGVFRYRGTQQLDHFTFEGTAGGLRSDNVYEIFIDRENVIWFGTDRGVCRYDPGSPRNEQVSTESESNFVRTLFQTKDGRLLCGSNRGLFIYDETTATWLPVSGFARKAIYAIAEDTGGQLLVGSSSGLYLNVDLQSGTAAEHHSTNFSDEIADTSEQRPGENVRAIRIFQGKTYLALFGRGVERLDGERRTLVWPGESADAGLREVTSLHVEGNDRLWIGTAKGGVFIFDGQRVIQEPALGKLSGSPIWAIDGTVASGLWFATARGLHRYRAGELQAIAPEMDVRSVVVNNNPGIEPSGVWCATSGGGLLRIIFDGEFGTLVSRLDVEQGLPSQNAFAILPLRSEKGANSLLIGTTRGIVRYRPGDALPVLIPTRLLSRRLHHLDEMRTKVRLDYPQSSLALEVAALSSRTFPEQFQYAFLLRDSAGQVIKKKLSHDSQFLMENLRPGDYHVEVRAFNKDLLASEPITFNFNIAKAPFPWTTTALSVLLVLAIIALSWAIIEHRRITRASTALARANKELASARLDLANEAERERRRIARDLHDQTLADLRHLLMLTDQLPTDGQGNGHGAPLEAAIFRSEIEAVSHEIRRICEDLSPSVLENVGLTAALEWALANAVAHAAPDCKFEYEFVCDEALEDRLNLAPGVQMQIYRIAQEALNNICRHSAATRVRFTVTDSPDSSFIMIIEDNGRGFDEQIKKGRKGRGLSNIRARARLIGADISWSKTQSGGTLFTLRKPKETLSHAALS